MPLLFINQTNPFDLHWIKRFLSLTESELKRSSGDNGLGSGKWEEVGSMEKAETGEGEGRRARQQRRSSERESSRDSSSPLPASVQDDQSHRHHAPAPAPAPALVLQ